MSDIDKDIEILKSIQNCIRANMFDLESEELQNRDLRDIEAIENVVSELEELRKYDIRKIELKNGGIEKAPSFTKREIELMNLGIALNETIEKSELETYKKITEKLETKLMFALSPTTHELALDTQSNFKRIIRENLETDTYTIRKELKKYWDDTLNYWARKEVEK